MYKTMINEQLDISRKTHLNPYIMSSSVTLINPYIQDQSELIKGKTIGSRYFIEDKLDVMSGESELFMCSDSENNRYVAKIYNRNTNINSEVIKLITKLSSPYIGECYEVGEYNGRLFEIIPYYKNGSLQGHKCSYEDLRNNIIPALNTALKVLHDEGVIHKDLKPSNIMRKDNGDIAVIDFGISSVIEEGMTMLVDKTGLTPAYSAPETFRDIFLKESDYYSLGITIYELYVGHQPYEGLSPDALERLVSVQRIPLPEDMPTALQDLITGLTYSDISNRRDKSNPNRRWTYEEVARWIAGEKQPVPGLGGSLLEKNPYEFAGHSYTDIAQLIDAMAMNWEAGKNELFRGSLTSYFEKVSDTIAEICVAAEQKASTVSGQDDIIFFETIYKFAPQYRRLYWKGMKWENLPALGRDILDETNPESTNIRYLAGDMMECGTLNRYISMFDNDNISKQVKLLSEISKLYIQAFDSAAEREKYIYELGYLLSGQIVLNIDNHSFYSVKELRDYMLALYNESYDKLRRFCQKLLDKKQEPTPQFEVWILAMGKGSELRKWKIDSGLIREEDIV